MKTVPLYGKKAAGRVALVDDEDYELVMQYRWNVRERRRHTGTIDGPYAVVSRRIKNSHIHFGMHNLIMGATGIDHANHDGLDNRRSNLRPATKAQNGANKPPQSGWTSAYKGVYWDKRRRRWLAAIRVNGKAKTIGSYADELQAAYAYDAAARELHGEFACPNFTHGPTQAMKDQWQLEREQRKAAEAERRRAAQRVSGWNWNQRTPESRICAVCGGEYQSKATRSFYCGDECRKIGERPYQREWKRRQREHQRAGGDAA